MRNLSLIVVGILLLCGCAKKEDPVKSYLAYNLADWDSYEEIERQSLPAIVSLPDSGLLDYAGRVLVLETAIDKNLRMTDSLSNLSNNMHSVGAYHAASLAMDRNAELMAEWSKLTAERDSLKGLIYEAFDNPGATTDSVSVVGLRYRARNNQGGMTIENKVFVSASVEGPVIRVYDDSIYGRIRDVILASKAGDIGFADNPYRLKAAAKK